MSTQFKVNLNKIQIIVEIEKGENRYFIREDGEYVIKKIFHFNNYDCQSDDVYEKFIFTLGDLLIDTQYFKIEKSILKIKYDLLLHKDLFNIKNIRKLFLAERDISIFNRIDNLINEPIIIGGDKENNIPIDTFLNLIKKFPTTREVTHYADSRIQQVLGEYFSTMSDSENKLVKLVNKKLNDNTQIKQKPVLLDLEISKFEFIRDELKNMLAEPDNSYHETKWGSQIANILTLIFPKYIYVLSETQIPDFYTKDTMSYRKPDFLLVDFNGNIDVLEIKKPFENKVLSSTVYRDNYVPHKELIGALVQTEKYLFHLNKWGKEGEKKLTQHHQSFLPENLKIQITNPRAIILSGRSHQFNEQQKLDFEIIKRQYANISDIMTYDDLIQRIDNILEMLQKSK